MKIFKVEAKKENLFVFIKQIIGFLALVVGICGIILPVLPGWLLIFIGLEILGIKIVFVDNIKAYALGKLNKNKIREKVI
jgi:hypothetical protein